MPLTTLLLMNLGIAGQLVDESQDKLNIKLVSSYEAMCDNSYGSCHASHFQDPFGLSKSFDSTVIYATTCGQEHRYPSSRDCYRSAQVQPTHSIQPWSLSGSGLFAGFDFLFMQATFDQNVAMVIDPLPGNTMVPFDYGRELTPRLYLGWRNCGGAGFRASFFRFDEKASTETATAVAGATPVYVFVYGAGDNLTRNAYADLGETLVSDHSLKLTLLDLEATQAFCIGQLRGNFGLGVRLARIDSKLRADVYDAGGGYEEAVQNRNEVEGAGPTASLQARLPISASRFSFSSRLRGALLMSQSRQSIYEMKNSGADQVEDIAEQDEVTPVLEFAIGLRYDQPFQAVVCNNRTGWFVSVDYECQAWSDVGGPVDSTSTLGLDGINLGLGVQY